MRVRLSAGTLIAIAIAMSCGGGGGVIDGGGDDGSGFVDTGGYDTPPSDFDGTSGQDTPPSDYDNPSSPGSGGDVPGSSQCASLCRALVSEGCTDVAPDATSCTVACSNEIASDRCGREAIDLLTCIVNAPEFTCEALEGGIATGQFQECTALALAYNACQDGGGEGGQGGI